MIGPEGVISYNLDRPAETWTSVIPDTQLNVRDMFVGQQFLVLIDDQTPPANGGARTAGLRPSRLWPLSHFTHQPRPKRPARFQSGSDRLRGYHRCVAGRRWRVLLPHCRPEAAHAQRGEGHGREVENFGECDGDWEPARWPDEIGGLVGALFVLDRLFPIAPRAPSSILFPLSGILPIVRHAYPLMLDVTQRLALIIGGGAVGSRKARAASSGRRHVRVVSESFDPSMPEEVERITARFEARQLNDCSLVFAATNNAHVNDEVIREAGLRGILACRADSSDQDPGDFTTPAMLESGPVIVTVSAGGNPALAARIRDALATRVDPAWARLADAMVTIRPMIMRVPSLDAVRRKAILRELASDAAIRAADGGTEGVLHWLVSRYPELQSHA